MTFHRVCLVVLVVGLAALTAATASESPTSPDLGAFTFEVGVPDPRLLPAEAGQVRVEVEGFRLRPLQSGLPDLPSRTVLVAIPPGSRPTLEIRPHGEREIPGVRPLPVALRGARLSDEDREALGRSDRAEERAAILSAAAADEYRPDSRIYEGRSTWPGPAARLGRTGVLHDQAYVEVELYPVAWDPALGGLRVRQSFEVTVHFGGDGEVFDVPANDRLFEPMYRTAFANYIQGRWFRRAAGERSAVAADAAYRNPGRSASRGSADPRYKLYVRQNGARRLDHATLSANAPDLLTEPVSTWRLSNRGITVPLRVVDGGTIGTIGPGDYVEFWGQALDDEPKSVLNLDQTDPNDLFEARDFTDENVYLLEASAGGATMPAVDATPTFVRTPATSVLETARAETDDAWRPLGGADPWFWSPSLLANSGPTQRTVSVPVPGLASATGAVQVRVHVRGLSPYSFQDDEENLQDHHTQVALSNSSAAILSTNSRDWDGRILQLHDFGYSGPALSNPLNVKLSVTPNGDGNPNDVILDWIEIDYARSFTAAGDAFVFDWPDADAEFVVGGLASSTPQIWEITLDDGESVVSARRLTGGVVSGSGPFAVRFRVDEDSDIDDGTARRFAVFGASAVSVPAGSDFEADVVSDLRDTTHQADWIVIGADAVLDDGPAACTGASPTGCLTELLAWRASPAGGDLSGKIVRLEDIEDEFNHGLPGPTAIREFLRWVMSDAPGEGWNGPGGDEPKPSYVLLVGDASFHYKAGTTHGNFTPTQILYKDLLEIGYYASDNLMAAVVGSDQLADLVVGRIPARSSAAANKILKKILDYEEAPPLGDWTERVLAISDRGHTGNNPTEAIGFEITNDASMAKVGPPFTATHLKYWTSYYGAGVPNPAQAMHNAILAQINGSGAALVQYIGHGNHVLWSDDAYFDERDGAPIGGTSHLTNGGRLPFLMAHNCLTGAFQYTSLVPGSADVTMGESWLAREGGGAVAVLAPSDPSYGFITDLIVDDVWDPPFDRHKERQLAVPVMAALTKLCSNSATIESCQAAILLGDPATRLQLRSVDPPTNVVAVGGNASVQLSWDPSATPGVTYQVWRTRTPQAANPNYDPVTLPDPTATSVTDTGLNNAVTYYYYVVARDPDGFDSRWSNFNTDCDVLGPDCKSATPLNPNPPSAPTGVLLSDPGTGNHLHVWWTASPQSDIATYTVYWGTASGAYGPPTSVGRTTNTILSGLTPGVRYYVAVKATNTSGLTSGFSNEANDFPVFAPGLHPPEFIADLRVRASGADLVLEWGAVTTDVYGKPMSPTRYDIYRGTPPAFKTENMTKIFECPAPCTSYTDVGARNAPGSRIYGVRAVGGDGSGGLGSRPPDGVRDLRVAPSLLTPGAYQLTWSPVTTDVRGGPTTIRHYLVFAQTQPFTQEAVRDQLISPVSTVTGTVVELTLPSPTLYYSVYTVDIRGNLSPY